MDERIKRALAFLLMVAVIAGLIYYNVGGP